MKYVIIGASAAGLAAAEGIRKTDKKGEITILTKEAYLPYSRPSISYYLKGVVEEKNIYLRKASFYKENNINIITNTEITKIIPEKKIVKAGRKEYPYDKLCIATGSKPFIPPMKNAEGNKNALTFLDLAATKEVKKAAKADTRAVVIGAGLIGMKAAEGLSKICKSVDVVELAPRILPSILDEKSAKSVKAHLEANKIKFHLKNTVIEAKSKNNKITDVILQNGEVLPCDLLIMAVGVRPETDIAQSAGLEVDRGIITNPATMQTSDESIYAAGDCTVSVDMLDGSKKIIALWPNAVQQGEVAGSQMAGENLTIDGTYSVNAIDFYGLRICTCGLINAQGEQYSEKIKSEGKSYKRLVFDGNKLVGFVLINSSTNAGIYTNLISNRVDINSLQEDIMNDPSLFMFDKDIRKAKLSGGMSL
ncbi:MAG: FAD-dependent oxidoreductase [Acetobacter sp.]|nr:FAD-dependent oxidoreductase [Bacteroides sp.]MCM1340194.1 FAD-dependent oxidoreductase [Acetobacter sp.]MCM1432854.1 FAD-dependent oxidoreductase [Clostridiales bacterium]